MLQTTGRLFTVRQSWREHYPQSALPSAGPLMEAAMDGTPDGDIALLYKTAIVYVDRDYVEEVTRDAAS